MSDGDSIYGQLTDLAKETTKQVLNVPKSIVKGIGTQTVGQDSVEKEAKKNQEKALTYHRIKEIEAEIARIRAENDKKTGPEVVKSSEAQSQGDSSGNKPKKLDEASRQALGRAEQGRNFKG